MSSADNPYPDARKQAEQLERSRAWLKQYFEARAAAKQPQPVSENAE